MQKIQGLKFLTAGMPITSKNKGYNCAFETLHNLNLDGLELEFVHGIRINQKTQEQVKSLKQKYNMTLSAHAPFYINLNSKEQDKIQASISRIIDTAVIASNVDAFSITYHAAFYMNEPKHQVFNQVKLCTKIILDKLEELNIIDNVWIRPETTGKPTQWGDLDEIIKLAKIFPHSLLPCIDFSHLHARSNGKFNSYDQFANIFEQIYKHLGQHALQNFHAHLAGIDYSAKGEKKHLNLNDSDMAWQDLLKAFKNFDVQGIIVCESPNIEQDAQLLKEFYLSL